MPSVPTKICPLALPSFAASVSAQHIRHVFEQPTAERVHLAGYAAAAVGNAQHEGHTESYWGICSGSLRRFGKDALPQIQDGSASDSTKKIKCHSDRVCKKARSMRMTSTSSALEHKQTVRKQPRQCCHGSTGTEGLTG